MAFQQPQQRPQPSRPITQHLEPVQTTKSPIRRRSIEESQEWILFSPAQNNDSQSTTSQTPRTATHLSEFGSLETHVRSQPAVDSDRVYNLQDIEDNESAELDSLDDGLHAFHHPVFSSSSNLVDQSGGTLLPTHDGLGTFTSPGALQETLWQYERHNPKKKHHRRRSSIQQRLETMEETENVAPVEDDKMARVEKWRLDQSRAVLEEIERETRRRRRRMSRMSASGMTASVNVLPELQQSVSASSRHVGSVATGSDETVKSEDRPSESFWQRLTRRVIRDLIGLDENTLSVIFGEQFIDDPSPTPTQPSPIAAAAKQESRVTFSDPASGWEAKLLESIARELGILVHQFTERPTGAFSTFRQTQQQPIDYAGIAVPQYPPSLRSRRRTERERLNSRNEATDSLFSPTIQTQQPASPAMEPADTSLWGIEEEPSEEEAQDKIRLRQEQEYWERDVDVKMLFSYLKRRFGSSPTPDTTTQSADAPPLPAAWATDASTNPGLGTSPESLRRAEFIRRQHPLVSRAAERAAAQSKRRESLIRRHHMQSILQKRTGSSSCASQSTKRSRRSRSGSSRAYWDIGGSGVGSGSGPAISSGLGGWGEV